MELELNKIELLEAKQANFQAQFESLKGQINPHFLFNSLNALSSLCYPEPKPERANEFIDEFSKIFRYILEIKDKSVVELKSELDFLSAYYYLQKIRFEEDLQLSIFIEKDIYNMLLPPLSLQLLVENAIKHNQIRTDIPLKISIEHQGNILVVRNNLLRRNKSDITSTKIGQTNLINRYQHISEQTPRFYEKDGYYIAEIPLLRDEN
jgi:LytS/YehU family sensor histidine kinase